ncbi:MAG TPA: hypothetical protein VFL69_03065 [Marmoricola sp.]|nr:hypothetical protein [Marmoricola sp.]
MKSTEDHLREMLSERAGRVQPGPVPEGLARRAARPPHPLRLPALVAAAAVVVVVAGAALIPKLGGGDDRQPAPVTSPSGSPAPGIAYPTHKLPATSKYPAAGVCGRAASSVVTIRIEPDTPMPRCAQVRSDQMLRVVNRTGDYGQRAHQIRVSWLPGAPVTLAPGESATFRRPLGDYLQPGVHGLRVTAAYGAEIWLR